VEDGSFDFLWSFRLGGWMLGDLPSSTFFLFMHKRGAFFGNQVKAKKVPTIFIRGTRVSNAFMIQQTFAMSTQLREVSFASGVIFSFLGKRRAT
jgi:hypothetical protein